MQIIDSGIVFSGTPGGDTQSAIFPYPCVSASGRWWCAFRAAPAKGPNRGQHILFSWTDDQGRHWSEPIEFFPPTHVQGRPGRFRTGALTTLNETCLAAYLCWVDDSEPDLPYFNEETEGLLDSRLFFAFSEDNGNTWSPPRLIDTNPFTCPTPMTGPMLVMPDGRLACQFELNKTYWDKTPWHHASVLCFSEDQGMTWPTHSITAQDPLARIFYWDQRPCVLPDCRVLVVFWTFDRQTSEYLNIHASASFDNGRTWSPLWDTGVPGQPAPIFSLGDGSLAMPLVDRTDSPTILVRRSMDGGHSWDAEQPLILHSLQSVAAAKTRTSMQDAWAEMSAFSIGLPSTAALPGGGALITYYAGPETDQTAIHWAIVQ